MAGARGPAFRDICSVCEGSYALTVKGLIGKHPASAQEFADDKGKCRGGGKLPKPKNSR
jgi:hypothetical protein